MRRKCINEGTLISSLERYGFVKIFPDSMRPGKIEAIFSQAECVIGILGEGMKNLKYCPQTTNSICILTPGINEIPNHLKESMEHTQIIYSNCTRHIPSPNKYSLYTRVKIINPYSPAYREEGEIEEYVGNTYIVRMNKQEYGISTRLCYPLELEAVDEGIDSPYLCDCIQVETLVQSLGINRRSIENVLGYSQIV